MPGPDQSSDLEAMGTRRSLVSRLRNLDDHESWQDFFNTYWKLIYSVARKAGLTQQEAEDVVQETTVAVSKYIQEYRYHPEVCSFKNWLLHKTRWKIIDQVRKRLPKEVAPPSATSDTGRTGALERIPDPHGGGIDEVWQEEWQRNLVDAAMERVKRRIKADHYQIFFLSVVRKLSPRKVAQILGVNIAQVYLVRHRVARLIRREIQLLEEIGRR